VNVKDVQDNLLSIIEGVQDGTITPMQAVNDFKELQADAKLAKIKITTNYTLGDFILIRDQALSEYESEELEGQEQDDEQ